MTWNDRIVAMSINPDMATRDDVARLAADLMDANARVCEHERGDKMILQMLNNPKTIAEGIAALIRTEENK